MAEACSEAFEAGVANGDVVLAILARKRQPPAPPSTQRPMALKLKTEPAADCARYDNLRKRREDAPMECHQIIDAMTGLKLYGMRASFDEIAGKGLARREELYPLLGSLIRAELGASPVQINQLSH